MKKKMKKKMKKERIDPSKKTTSNKKRRRTDDELDDEEHNETTTTTANDEHHDNASLLIHEDSLQENHQKKKKKKDKKMKDKKMKKEHMDHDATSSAILNYIKGSSKDNHREEKKMKKEQQEEDRPNKKKRKKQSHDDDDENKDQPHENGAAKKEKLLTTDVESSSPNPNDSDNDSSLSSLLLVDDRMVVSSALECLTPHDIQQRRAQDPHTVTLLLFYQYVQPPWSAATYDQVLKHMHDMATQYHITGRMRVAKEGLNCTLTATCWADMLKFCHALRDMEWEGRTSFKNTEFKLTKDLPRKQAFPSLKVIPVLELVHYGTDPHVASNLVQYTGTHLEPKDYHDKLAQDNTVVIDVRNHYEAKIGRFVPPTETNCQYMDPRMRKSTEFPFWLQKPETHQALKGKQVLMYCTGGVRCERATALLKYKMETDENIKALNIQGVYQLQGGIDKYFREFPNGGFWKGKNYTFDKRFAHAPPAQAAAAAAAAAAASVANNNDNQDKNESSTAAVATPSAAAANAAFQPEEKPEILGNCEACDKPWDMYRGKRRCPTCGVPSLICRECFEADKKGIRKLGRSIRCDLCVQEGITSKAQLKAQEEQAMTCQKKQKHGKLDRHKSKSSSSKAAPKNGHDDDDDNMVPAHNPNNTTRLYLKNLCVKKTDEESLVQAFLPHSTTITHIVWRNDHRTGQFLGQAWVEVKSPLDAAHAVARDGRLMLWGRSIHVSYQPPDGKDRWPPPHSVVQSQSY